MIDEREALAGLRILVAIAKADGKYDDREKAVLEKFFAELKFPPGVTVQSVFDEPGDFDTACAAIKTSEGRKAVFGAAVAVAVADRVKTKEEGALLTRLRTSFEMDESVAVAGDSLYNKLLGRTGWFVRKDIQPIADPELREHKVRDAIRRATIWGAVYGWLPTPIVDVLLLNSLQLQLANEIATYWGQPFSTKETFGALAGAAGVNTLTFGALSLLKLVPIWGHVAGSASGFVMTSAFGTMVNEYFKSQGRATKEELRATFDIARDQAKREYGEQKVRIAEQAKDREAKLAALSKDFENGALSVEEFERAVEKLHES